MTNFTEYVLLLLFTKEMGNSLQRLIRKKFKDGKKLFFLAASAYAEFGQSCFFPVERWMPGYFIYGKDLDIGVLYREIILIKRNL